MRTFAARQRDMDEARYEDAPAETDPKTITGAKTILSSRGGKKAAKIALAQLWRAANNWEQGYMPTATLNAPLRVLEALETMSLIERADDDRGVAIRFRLTDKGLTMAGV
jgi:hypothetical protein